MKGLQSVCPECHRKFKTESGLKWHLFHIHGWKDIQKIIKAPSPYQLAEIAVKDEILLAAYAKGLGMEVEALKRLIKEHFGEQIE